MNNSILTDGEFKEVKALLPRGSMAKIARKLKVHRNSVEYVLQGRWYNAEILEEAIKIANEVKLKQQKQAEVANMLNIKKVILNMLYFINFQQI